jgi:hypothetical protein
MIRPFAFILLTLLLLVGCDAAPTIGPRAATRPFSPEALQVQAALAQWPDASDRVIGLRRTFFTTIHAAGKRTTASGILHYYGPRDLRVTAITEMGAVLFDARINWAGVKVIRTMPGLDAAIVETLVHDLALAFIPPPTPALGRLEIKRDAWILHQSDGDNYKYAYTFNPADARLRQQDVALGAFDTLHILYTRYNSRGWPQDLHISRPARLYTIAITFTNE